MGCSNAFKERYSSMLASWLSRRLNRPSPSSRKPAGKPVPRRDRLAVELLEERCLPSTFTVTNTNDSGGGSLRNAIKKANADPGSTILFSIASGVQTIIPASALPDVTADGTVIDGWSQGGPGYQGSPLIFLKGAT